MRKRKISQLVLEKLERNFGKDINRQELYSLLHDFNNKEGKRGKKSAHKRTLLQSREKELHEIIRSLVRLGVLLEKGKRFQVTSKGFVQGVFAPIKAGGGFVKVDFGSEEVFVPGYFDGKALAQDYVLVKLDHFARQKWQGRIERVLKSESNLVFALYMRPFRTQKKGLHLVHILDQPGMDRGLVKDARLRSVSSGAPLLLKLSRDKGGFVHTGEKDFALAEVTRIFDIGERDVDFYRVSVKNRLPLQETQSKYLKKLQKKAQEATQEEELIQRLDREGPWPNLSRRDLRPLFAVTIDGAEAKDFDDAISVVYHKGSVHLYVHIADLATWLAEGSDLDRDAMMRGNSSYLQHRVIPMLPPFLSEQHCSLRQGEDKATLTCELVYDKDYRLQRYEFYPSLIRVDERLTYERAEKILSAKNWLGLGKTKGETRRLLQQAEKLTLALRRGAQKQGRMDLDMPELSVERGEELAAPVHIRLQTTLRSHRIIEDAMLAANRAAAQLLKEKGVGALFRIHEKPDYDKIFTLQQELDFFGIKWEVDPEDPQKSLAQLVTMVRGHQLEGMLQFLILRSMKQAQYANDPRVGHFGLGFADYLHFTSPIRRYPDLVVHRQIRNLLAGKGSFYSGEQLEHLGQHCSMTERLSMMAERDMFKLAVCRYLSSHEGKVFRAMVSGVSRFGLYVTLMETPVEGRLLFENIHGDYYVYLDNERAAYGQRTGHRVKMGNVLEVELLSVDWAQAVVDFTFDPLVHEQKTPKKGDASPGQSRSRS